MALAGNDTCHYQSTEKTYEFTKLEQKVKFSLEWSECLVLRLFFIFFIKIVMSETIWHLLAT